MVATRESKGPAAAGLGAVLVIYLTGLLIGGLYVGMVSPVRTVVQAHFGIDGSLGIWMINIYTLFYAALIPVVGKLADRRGRKLVFTVCVGLFCVGSALCGISQDAGGFALLLGGRVLQAAGAGGMIPVANAAIGTTFPEEKRGMALGIAAAVAGVSNVLGAAAGSAVVGLFGTGNWCAMFYLCIPFCLVLMLAAWLALPADVPDAARGKMDLLGSCLFALFVLLLLLGVKELDFANLGASAANPLAWGPLLAAVAVLPLFRHVESRAADPVFHLDYLHNRQIVVTMVVSFFIGCFIIAMVLIPEFAEYAMGDPLGSGGYYVLAIGLTSFVITPMAGKLIDRLGPKRVLMTGLSISVVGMLFLALVATAHPSLATLVAGLAIMGVGMGLSMGAPTNYMILQNTDAKDSASAVATIALVRQVGTSLAPAIYVGLIAATPGMAGYSSMLLAVAAFNALALVTMLFYRDKR